MRNVADIARAPFSLAVSPMKLSADVGWTHLRLLVWKCYVIVVKRHWLAFCLELVAPAVVSLTLVFARENMDYSKVPNVTHYEPFKLKRLPPRFDVPPPSAARWILLYAPDTNVTAAVLTALAASAVPPLSGTRLLTQDASSCKSRGETIASTEQLLDRKALLNL